MLIYLDGMETAFGSMTKVSPVLTNICNIRTLLCNSDLSLGGTQGCIPHCTLHLPTQMLKVLQLLENSLVILFQSGLFWRVGWGENSLLLFKDLCSSSCMCLGGIKTKAFCLWSHGERGTGNLPNKWKAWGQVFC